MTENKPIIVYGIDVSECLLFDKRKGICFKNKKSCSAICSYATYKLREQLYYKTQECEQKEKDIKFLTKCLDNSFKTQQDSELYWEREKKKLKAENEKYKKKFQEFFNIDNQECWNAAFLQNEKAKAEQKLKFVENVLYINYQLWMYYIANGINNSSNHTILDLIEDFATSVRLLANTLDIQDNTLNYYTKDSIVYDKKNKELQKLNNEVRNAKND